MCDPRRWIKNGVWRTNLINQAAMLWYRRGATPEQIFGMYYDKVAVGAPPEVFGSDVCHEPNDVVLDGAGADADAVTASSTAGQR